MEHFETPPTLTQVIMRLQTILESTASRESVSAWAETWVMAREPDVTDEKAWELLKLAAGVDLKDSPRSYLHSEADIHSWIEPFVSQV